MNTNARRNRLAIAITAAAVLGGLMLAGCTPVDPGPTLTTATPTPTPTATTDPQPESEAEAIEGAELAIDDYLFVRSQVNADGGTDTTPLETVATGHALQVAVDDAGRVVELGWRTEGQLSFDPTSSYAAPLTLEGETFEFSSISVTGCQDGTGYRVFEADGKEQTPDTERNVLEFTVIWAPDRELYLVNNIIDLGQTC